MSATRYISRITRIALALFLVSCAHAAPAVDAARAAKIATDYLNGLGGRAPHIVSMTLESSALVKGTQSWVVRWSSAIDAEDQREIGLRVRMDGSVARLMEDKTAASKKAAKRPPSR
jgi:hypothetical protein